MKVYLAMESAGESMEARTAFSSMEKAKAEVERKTAELPWRAGLTWKESDGAWWLGNDHCVREMVVDEEKV